MTIDELIVELSKARIKAQACRDAHRKAMEEFEASPAWKIPFTEEQSTNAVVSNIEAEIRELALGIFTQNGNKNPHEKVAIKIFKTFKVLDVEKVREWCAVNLAKALKPDIKMVEKYAVEFGDVPGTQKGDEARAQIASVL